METADTALLVTTPDVVAVRGAKRAVRMWERLQIRKAQETTVVVNRHTRSTEIQPPLIQKITGTAIAATTVPANFKELQGAVDAGRVHELDAKSTVKQALWALAGELGLVAGAPEGGRKGHGHGHGRFRGDRGDRGDRGPAGFRRRKDGAG
ncbi:MinD/ParA family protein OS=Streptomyces tendae OX=1932 GN=GUR47_15710 PE=4 SV=1 [Streptomyces tendae]